MRLSARRHRSFAARPPTANPQRQPRAGQKKSRWAKAGTSVAHLYSRPNPDRVTVRGSTDGGVGETTAGASPGDFGASVIRSVTHRLAELCFSERTTEVMAESFSCASVLPLKKQKQIRRPARPTRWSRKRCSQQNKVQMG